MTVTEFFQKALTLEEGEKMLIPCISAGAQESMRVRLYQLRRQAMDDNILISKVVLDNKLFVSIQKVSLGKAFIMKPDGAVVQVEEGKSLNVGDTSLERIVQSARSDKYPVEDLILDLQETYSKSEIEGEWNKQEEERADV